MRRLAWSLPGSVRDLRWNGDDGTLPVRKPQPLRPVWRAALRSPPQCKLLRFARPQHFARARVLRIGPHVRTGGLVPGLSSRLVASHDGEETMRSKPV